MKLPKAWFAGKLSEPCTCSSGLSYRQCCYHRECVYLIIGALAAFTLFGAHELPALLIILPALLLAAFGAKMYYDRQRNRRKNHEDHVA